MKKLKLLTVIGGMLLALSLAGNAQDPQQMQNMMRMFQNMSPEQMDNMRRVAESLGPEQMQAMREQFFTMDPQQQMDMLQQFSNADPQQMLKDPQQMLNSLQQRAADSLRQRLGITDDEEWSLINAKIAAVRKAQNVLAPYRSGMGGGFGGGRSGRFGSGSPDGRALTESLATDASEEMTQTLLAKFRAVREEKQKALTTAQDELRALLTVRQEAIITLSGLLE